jgi:hypothetical protein
VDGDPLRFSEAYLIDRALDSCGRVRVRCLDLRPSLGQLQPPQKRWVNMFDHHPNGEANRVAAQAVLEAFEQEWLALASRDSIAIEPD